MVTLDIEELMRTASIDTANDALRAGWKLVTVVTPIGTNGLSVPTYILGWPAGKQRDDEPEEPSKVGAML
jgi:hypothetical protein